MGHRSRSRSRDRHHSSRKRSSRSGSRDRRRQRSGSEPKRRRSDSRDGRHRHRPGSSHHGDGERRGLGSPVGSQHSNKQRKESFEVQQHRRSRGHGSPDGRRSSRGDSRDRIQPQKDYSREGAVPPERKRAGSLSHPPARPHSPERHRRRGDVRSPPPSAGGDTRRRKDSPPPPPPPPRSPVVSPGAGAGAAGGGRWQGSAGDGGGGGSASAAAAAAAAAAAGGAKPSHYGPAGTVEEGGDEEAKPKPVDAANFGLSGALAKDVETGNVYKGVVLKWSEPEDARPPTKKWRLYVFKGAELSSTLHIHRQSAYLVGRERKIADIPVDHPSCSKQHAVLQYRLKETVREAEMQTVRTVRPYVMDLESTNGTFLNGERLEPGRYYELLERDCLRFGSSSREYVLLHDKSQEAG